MEQIRNDLLRLGAEVCQTVSRGTEILLNGTLAEGRELIEADKAINELSTNIELASYDMLIGRVPPPAELRTLITTQKLVGELERSADLVVNICNSARRMHGEPIPPRIRDLVTSMSAEAVGLLKLSLDAYEDSDLLLAAALSDMDDVLDQLNRDMIEAIFEANSDGELEVAAAVQLALVSRYYERIGDHAVNIGERVVYIDTGELPDDGLAVGDLVRSAREMETGGVDGGLVEAPPEPVSGALLSEVLPSEGLPSEGLEFAVSNLPIGLLVVDESGETIFRNRFAELGHLDRQESLLIQEKIVELTGRALEGISDEHLADFWGPPRRSLEVRAAPVLVDGVIVGASVIVEDVSDRHRLLNIRRDFVANMSHELRTPIGAVSVLAETLLNSHEPDVVERLCTRLHRESLRLGNTIEDLLTLSELETENLSEAEPVRVDEIFAAAMDRVEQRSMSHQISMTVSLEDPALTLNGDQSQLISAVGNLVDNAAKYSESGSTIELSGRRVGERIEIGVVDHGIGIPESELERIFERFYRVDPARSRATGGTGLGLSIVRHVVENHSGDIRVVSREGEGSTFTLVFPVAGPVRTHGGLK